MTRPDERAERQQERRFDFDRFNANEAAHDAERQREEDRRARLARFAAVIAKMEGA